MSDMDAFFDTTDEDRLDRVRNDAENVAGYSAREVDTLWTQIRYLKRAEKLKLMEWWMRTEAVQDRLDYWETVKRESSNQGDHLRTQDCEHHIAETLDDLARCDTKREECRRTIQELERLEERTDPYLQ